MRHTLKNGELIAAWATEQEARAIGAAHLANRLKDGHSIDDVAIAMTPAGTYVCVALKGGRIAYYL